MMVTSAAGWTAWRGRPADVQPRTFQEILWPCGARIFAFGRSLGEGHVRRDLCL